MADELLLASTRVEPKRLLDSGFRFRFPELEAALVHAVQ
jgi:NAD dependent epimerase/dehydratase family enzyme